MGKEREGASKMLRLCLEVPFPELLVALRVASAGELRAAVQTWGAGRGRAPAGSGVCGGAGKACRCACLDVCVFKSLCICVSTPTL